MEEQDIPMEILDVPNQVAPTGYEYNEYGDLITANQNYWRKRGSNYARSYYEDGKYGMRASDGTILIAAQYDQIHFAYGGFMIAAIDGKHGVVNEANEVIIPFEYYSLQIIYADHAARIPGPEVQRDELRLIAQQEKGQVGIIDGNGQVVSPFRESRLWQVQYFYEAPRNDRGNIMSPPEDYQKILEETALVYRFDGAGILNGKGDTILPFIYDDIETLYGTKNPAWIQVEKDGKHGLYDLAKGWLLPMEYGGELGLLHLLVEDGKPFYPTLFIAQKEVGTRAYGVPILKAGLIDSTGQEILPFEFDGFGTSFMLDEKRHFVANKEGDWGLINSDHKVIIPFQHTKFLRKYDLDGKPCFALKDSTNTYYGILSLDNELIVPYQYKWFDECNGQLLEFLKEDGQGGLLNAAGEEVFIGDYPGFALLRGGYFQCVNSEGLNGIVSPDGKLILEPTFKGVYPEELIASFSTYFRNNGINEEDVITVLSKDDKVFAFLKNEELVEFN